MSIAIDDPPNSRLFVVAGRNTSADFLRGVFEQYGLVVFVKYLREKGVAYVKYDRASSAALAIEDLHEVTLNEGRGPRLKVMLADAPHTRSLGMPSSRLYEDEVGVSTDPDNVPPRSRLFMVVPKSADGAQIEAEMEAFGGMQYCKTDLIESKGIVFVKYARSSTAFLAMERVSERGSIAGYKVKIMLAEPKTRRGGMGGASGSSPLLPGLLGASAAGGLGYGGIGGAPGQLLSGLGPGSQAGPTLAALHDFAGGGGLGALAGLTAPGFGSLPPGFGYPPAPYRVATPPVELGGLLEQSHLADLQACFGLGSLGLPQASSHRSLLLEDPPQGRRLLVVVPKGVSEEVLHALFRVFPGFEAVDLPMDQIGVQRVATVTYSSPEAVAAAARGLSSMEFPPGSGQALQVAKPVEGSASCGDLKLEGDEAKLGPTTPSEETLRTPGEANGSGPGYAYRASGNAYSSAAASNSTRSSNYSAYSAYAAPGVTLFGDGTPGSRLATPPVRTSPTPPGEDHREAFGSYMRSQDVDVLRANLAGLGLQGACPEDGEARGRHADPQPFVA